MWDYLKHDTIALNGVPASSQTNALSSNKKHDLINTASTIAERLEKLEASLAADIDASDFAEASKDRDVPALTNEENTPNRPKKVEGSAHKHPGNCSSIFDTPSAPVPLFNVFPTKQACSDQSSVHPQPLSDHSRSDACVSAKPSSPPHCALPDISEKQNSTFYSKSVCDPAMAMQLGDKSQIQLNEMNKENVQLREQTCDRDDAHLEYLRKRIKFLELENAKIHRMYRMQDHLTQIPEVSQRYEKYITDIKSVQSVTFSRQTREINSLLDQNEILRSENKRLIEQEITLKERIVAIEAERRAHDIEQNLTPKLYEQVQQVIRLLDEQRLIQDHLLQLERDDSKTQKEAHDTIKQFSSDLQKLQADNNVLEPNLKAIQQELVQIKKISMEGPSMSNAVLVDQVLQAVEGKNANGASVDINDIQPLRLQKDDLIRAEHAKQMDELRAVNVRLQEHQDHLMSTIEGWKRENAELRADLEKLKHKSEPKLAKLQSTVERLEAKLDDERLKTRDFGKLICSLQRSLHKARKGHRMNATLVPDIRDELHLLLLGLLKGNEVTTKEVAEMTMTLEDQLSILRTQNQSLKEDLAEAEDKLVGRESVWVAKYKAVQDDLKQIRKQNQDRGKLLVDYRTQFTAIQQIGVELRNPALSISDEPLQFTTLFSHIYDLYVSVKHHAETLHAKVDELNTMCEGRVLEVQRLSARHETEKERTHTLEQAMESQMRKINELQTALDISNRQKSILEAKLKRLAAGYSKFFLAPIIPLQGAGDSHDIRIEP